jgi:hypothetical protein
MVTQRTAMIALPTGRFRPVSDPRTRSDGLGSLTRALFGDERLSVIVAAEAADGVTPLAQYIVVPSARAPRFLVPLAAAPVREAALSAFNRLRPTAVRRRRAVLAKLLRLHPTLFGRLPVLTVQTRPDAAGTDPAELLLSARVGRDLGVRAYAALGVHPPDPNLKPTLQMLDDAGRPVAYVKVGWNDASRMLVRTEAEALRELDRGSSHFPLVPGLLAAGTFGEQTYVAVAPLPADVRRLPDEDDPQVDAVLAVARSNGTPAARQRLADSAFAARLTGPLASVLHRHGDVALEFGSWHGDWVPWNLARSGPRLVAWDWEHHGTDVPVGSDVVHHGFQVALTLRGADAAGAARAGAATLLRHAAASGLSVAQVEAVVDCYLAELWLRTKRLADAGAGWNAKLHPGLLEVLAARAP